MNEQQLKALKPREKRYRVALGDNLYFQVQPTGRKSYQYRQHNSFRHLADWPYTTLKSARQKLRVKLVQQVKPSAPTLFGDVAEKYIEEVVAKLAPRTSKNNEARIRKWLLPPLGHRRIDNITAAELLDVLRAIERQGKESMARRVKILYGQIARHGLHRDITVDLRGRLAPRDEHQHPGITDPRELAQLLRAIDSHTGHPPAVIGLQLTPLLALRPSEMRLGRWSEVDLFDNVWRIPEERMKMRRKAKGDHVVPLSTQAVERLSVLRRFHNGDLMFPGVKDKSRPISDATLNTQLRQLGWSADRVVCHGFRTTFSTLLNEQGVNPDYIEAQLAHRPKGVRAIYNGAAYLPQRREMMQSWANYLDEIKLQTTVTRH